MEKIDELVKREVSKQLLLAFPDSIISVTDVEVSKDLSYAKIWISSLNDIDQTVKACQALAPEITRTLASRIKAKRVPKLSFIADKSGSYYDKIVDIIDNLHKDDK